MQVSRTSIIVLALLAVLIAACGGSTTSSRPMSSPSQTFSGVEPTMTVASPVATPGQPEAGAPLPTTRVAGPPSADPVPGSCLVVEEQYCRLSERVSWQQTPWGVPIDVVGFRLPVGTLIFAPFDDLVSGTAAPSDNLMNPDAATVTVYSGSDPSATMFQAVGDFALEPGARQPSTTTGTPLGRVEDTGVQLFGDYNLIVAFAKSAGTEGFVADQVLIVQLFPSLGSN